MKKIRKLLLATLTIMLVFNFVSLNVFAQTPIDVNLTADEERDYVTTIASGQTMNLHLNGYNIKNTGTTSLFNVEVGGTLNIYDNNTSRVQYGQWDSATNKYVVTDTAPSGKYDTLTGGVIYGTGNKEEMAHIQISCIFNSGTTTVRGGNIAGNTATNNSGAIFNSENASLTIQGGNFISNTASYGGVVSSSGTINIDGGVFENNTASVGGVFNLSGNSTLTINGGQFINNTATGSGGVINSSGATVVIDSGEFKNNTSAKGGALNFAGNTTASIKGDTIIQNNSVADGIFGDTGKGAGIHVQDTNLFLGGNINISSNTYNGTLDNIYIEGDQLNQEIVSIPLRILSELQNKIENITLAPTIVPAMNEFFTLAVADANYNGGVLGSQDASKLSVSNAGQIVGLVLDKVMVSPPNPSTIDLYGSVSVKLNSGSTEKLSNIEIILKQGNTEISKTTTNSQGSYHFLDVKSGFYNIVATYNGLSMTEFVEVKDVDTGREIVFASQNIGAEVETPTGNTIAPVVGGLNEFIENLDNPDNDTLNLKLSISSASSAAQGTSEIKEAAQKENIDYLEISFVKENLTDSTSENITDTNTNIIELMFYYDLSNKDNVTIYRYHDGEVHTFTENDTKGDGTFRVDRTNNLIYMYTSKFSTYAIGYNNAQIQTPSTGSTTSTNAQPTPTSKVALPILENDTQYSITIEIEGEGTVSPMGGDDLKVDVSKNDSKTFTFTPNDGYIVKDVLVNSESKGSLNEYTFEDVNANHTLKVVFEKAEEVLVTHKEETDTQNTQETTTTEEIKEGSNLIFILGAALVVVIGIGIVIKKGKKSE